MIRTLTTLALAGATLAGLSACTSYSEDRSVFKSTYTTPRSVYVRDVATGETIWSYDVPPQHLIAVEFDSESNFDLANNPGEYPTRLVWDVYPINATKSKFREGHYWDIATESGQMPLQGRPVLIGSIVGEPVDPASVPRDRSIEEIEADLPEPGEAELPEPDGTEDSAETPEPAPAE